MATRYDHLDSHSNSPLPTARTPYGTGDPYYNGSTGHITPQAPKRGISKWIKIGLSVLVLIIVGAVVGAVVGTRSSKSSSTTSAAAAASSAASAKQEIGIFPTATDSEFMMPIYPATVSIVVSISVDFYSLLFGRQTLRHLLFPHMFLLPILT